MEISSFFNSLKDIKSIFRENFVYVSLLFNILELNNKKASLFNSWKIHIFRRKFPKKKEKEV
jgi:hypothetical protein